MKIGFLGNTNNYPFTLARAFRRAGHDVLFIVDELDSLHRPEGKYPEVEADYGDWLREIVPIRPIDIVLNRGNVRKARKLLADRDLLVLNDFGPAVFARSATPTFIILTGADLESYANPAYAEAVALHSKWSALRRVGSALKRGIYRRLVRLQRLGISRAALVEYSFPGLLPPGDTLLGGMGVGPERRCWFMLTDPLLIPFSEPPDNKPLRVFGMARLNWVRPFPIGINLELDDKRTDLLLEGLAEFFQQSGEPLDIRLVKKGLHVEQTMRYAQELGIDRWITWLREMTQSEFYSELASANIVMDHFGSGTIGLGVRDALAAGRPVIVNEPTGLFARYLGEDLPVLRAATRQEIARQLQCLCSDRNLRHTLGARARAFAERHCSPDVAAKLIMERTQPWREANK